MATWVMGGRLSVMRPIHTFPVNINDCSIIDRVIVASLLRHRPTSTIVTKIIKSTIARGRVVDIKIYISNSTIANTMINSAIYRGRFSGLKMIPMPMSSINRRHFNTFVIRNTIDIIMVVGRMAVLSIKISKNSITTHY